MAPTAPAAPPRFHVMAKPTGAVCNLACTYCFFLDKELLYPGSPFRMSDEALEAYIRQLIDGHRTPQVTVAWQGGEPTLMGLDFFRRAIELQERGLEIKPSKAKPLSIPQQLKSALAKNEQAAAAFKAMTKGKQREYADYIAEAKREETKHKRLEKVLPMIAAGKGLNDQYRKS